MHFREDRPHLSVHVQCGSKVSIYIYSRLIDVFEIINTADYLCMALLCNVRADYTDLALVFQSFCQLQI